MNFNEDERIVLTLDAGGTNFVFSAIQGNKQIIEEIILPSNANDLEKCLSTIIQGFATIITKLSIKPAAISFAFPGPADYPNGIIGDLQNLPAFKGGIALGPMLEDKFQLPVFINNDGDLFAYGEAIGGYLNYINNLLEKSGNPKRYKNLLGLTFGTGFGAGIVSEGNLFRGDNSIAGEIWLLRDKLNIRMNVEEHVSIRGIKKVYARESGLNKTDVPEPRGIYEICTGKIDGNKNAALKAFQEFGEAAGDAISNAVTLVDSLVVIGGGLSGAASVFLPHLIKEMNGNFINWEGTEYRRLTADVYNLENENELRTFLQSTAKEINIYRTEKKVKYDPQMRIGVGISKLGTSKAVSIGAYAFALNSLDKK
jgi:glucokinase